MIKIVFLDVDGTLTDGKIYMSETGELFKAFNVKDGLGIKKLIANNIIPVVITGRKSKIVENRCKELGIKKIHQNISDKKSLVLKVLEEEKLLSSNAAYIGDDENDLEAMMVCSFSFSPSDASQKVKDNASYVLSLNGGEGCVREAIEYILLNK